jgi:nicotinate (nicotinamide) nucleotide adenylyltransferase
LLRLFFTITDKNLLKVRKVPDHEAIPGSAIFEGIEFAMTTPQYMMTWTSLLPDLEPDEARQLLRFVSARYPFSPDYEKLKAVCLDAVFSDHSDEWIFFGGSFNPWHAGHQACLKLVAEDKPCFVLPDRNPFKEIRELDPVFTTLSLSAQVKFKKNQFLVPTFLLNDQKNPTAEWIGRVRKNMPDKKLSLLMGHDSLEAITKWTHAQELLNEVHCLYVVSRLETDAARDTAAAPAKKMAPKLNVEFLGHHDFENLSSTNLRKKN